MQFDSLSDFLAMGGYAFYVWTSYAIAAVLLAWNIIAPWRRLRGVRAHIARELRLAEDTRGAAQMSTGMAPGASPGGGA